MTIYQRQIIKVFPHAKQFVENGLISDYTAKIFCVKKDFMELKAKGFTAFMSREILAEQYFCSTKTIRNYVEYRPEITLDKTEVK